jgi:hypothetical protein
MELHFKRLFIVAEEIKTAASSTPSVPLKWKLYNK